MTDAVKTLPRLATSALMLAFVLLFAGGALGGEKGMHHHAPATPPHEHPVSPVRMTMEELHRHGGVPPGWRFRLPQGDPEAGRAVYRQMKCFECHEVKGAGFPPTTEQNAPELTGMGPHHPAEYFAEAILNPNSVIITGPGHAGPDGLSIMPDYNDSLTVSQLVDLVAYLKSLRGEHQHHKHKGHDQEKSHREKDHERGKSHDRKGLDGGGPS